MTRKEFIKSCGKVAAGAAFSGLLWQSCAGLHYASWTKSGDRIIIPKSEFTERKSGKIKEREIVLIKTSPSDIPIGVYKTSSDGYIALLLKCTHRGCELNPGGGIYSCPCHGSEFSMEGAVLQGPAEEHLTTYKTTTDHENIYIHLL